MGFEVSKAHTRPSLVLSLPPTCGSDVGSQLLLQCHARLLNALLPNMMVTDSLSETVSNP